MKETSISQKSNTCEEEPVILYLNGKKLVTFMCTLQNIKDLAVGYLFSNSIINSFSDLASLAACDQMKEIYAITLNRINWEHVEMNAVLMSSCGSGSGLNVAISHLQKVQSAFSIPLDEIKEQTIKMLSNAEIYKRTGGMHCTALSNQSGILDMCEDVGRHNAVDKVIGKGVFLNIDFTNTMIITTGRISTDMVLKAVNICCPMIVSISIATTMALRLAKELGIKVIGRVLSTQPILY